ncbi:hypothetical protein SLE2022_387250 [Rubroshorea leprosula]
MALSFAFRGRLEQMEQSRNQRLSLLQTEKELQADKYRDLEAKLANIRSMEQRCLLLDQKIASQNLKISTLKSEVEDLYAKYDESSAQLKVLKSELEELEQVEKEKDRFYELKGIEMEKFKEDAERFLVESRMQVEGLRNRVNELKSTFVELQGNNGYLSNSEIAAAEMRKAELMSVKENLMKILASNYQRRAQLQQQVQNMFTMQNQERR